MPNSISNKPGFYDDSPPAASSAQNKQPSPSDEARKEQSSKVQSQRLELEIFFRIFFLYKTQTSSFISSANSNSGWFGGIWNKLSMKPKNQMILPDDKNPSVRHFISP